MTDVFWPGIVSIGVMYLGVFLVGVWASRQGEGGEGTLGELMLAGRRLPLGLGLLTMTATWVGGGYINGTAEYTYARGLTWGLQAPIGYALSLVVGGLFFAGVMRRNGYTTLVDPLEQRFGRFAAGSLLIVAVLSELIWSAAILVALGTTFGTVIGLDLGVSIVVSAAVAIGYTVTGGLWSVAWTDAVQLVLIVVGLLVAMPFALAAAGGLDAVTAAAATHHGVVGFSSPHEAISYADLSLLLILGGIPWNIYFQRVLATPDELTARRLSIGGGVLCALMAIPAIVLGLCARATDWGALAAAATGDALPGDVVGALAASPSMVLPLQLRLAVPPAVSIIGLGAVAAAVMASVDSSILSATSMLAWNGYRRLLRPNATTQEMVRLMRVLIVVLGGAAAFVAVSVRSVAALWYLCGDVVYCLLFPQLVLALFDKKANRTGAMAGWAVALVLRLGGGEPSIGLPAFIPYPVWDEAGLIAFPFRTLAMVMGLATAWAVSRATTAWDAPRALMTVGGNDAKASIQGS